MNPSLAAENIDKHYDGVHALKGVSFEVAPGEVHALIGENGAGKSTLGKVLAGVVRPDSGRILIGGRVVPIHRPLDAQRRGISIIFQELDLFTNLTVAENLAIGNLHLERRRLVRFRQLDRRCRPFLEQVGLGVPSDAVLGSLPIGQMQLVAIARALSMEARWIIMDEPTSSLSDDAVDNLFDLIRKLKRSGVSIIYVSHKMEEIFRIADRITVLRDGCHVGTREAGGTSVDELIRMMVGREVSDVRPARGKSSGKVLLSVRDLATRRLKGISFDLRAGEVLGVAGLVGAGRSELGAALFGLDKVRGGSMAIRGKVIRPRTPRAAMRRGIGLLPEDRKLQGLMMSLSVKENSTLSVLGQLQVAGFVRRRKESQVIRPVHQRTALVAASPDVAVSTLSGGNQQKVLLSKWLLVNPDVIFLDDPTRGIDVGAKQDIYQIINELAQSDKGVILVSSELPELLQCSDRIMVLHEGENMGILDGSRATQEEILALATKTAAPAESTNDP